MSYIFQPILFSHSNECAHIMINWRQKIRSEGRTKEEAGWKRESEKILGVNVQMAVNIHLYWFFLVHAMCRHFAHFRSDLRRKIWNMKYDTKMNERRMKKVMKTKMTKQTPTKKNYWLFNEHINFMTNFSVYETYFGCWFERLVLCVIYLSHIS